MRPSTRITLLWLAAGICAAGLVLIPIFALVGFPSIARAESDPDVTRHHALELAAWHERIADKDREIEVLRGALRKADADLGMCRDKAKAK